MPPAPQAAAPPAAQRQAASKPAAPAPSKGAAAAAAVPQPTPAAPAAAPAAAHAAAAVPPPKPAAQAPGQAPPPPPAPPQPQQQAPAAPPKSAAPQLKVGPGWGPGHFLLHEVPGAHADVVSSVAQLGGELFITTGYDSDVQVRAHSCASGTHKSARAPGSVHAGGPRQQPAASRAAAGSQQPHVAARRPCPPPQPPPPPPQPPRAAAVALAKGQRRARGGAPPDGPLGTGGGGARQRGARPGRHHGPRLLAEGVGPVPGRGGRSRAAQRVRVRERQEPGGARVGAQGTPGRSTPQPRHHRCPPHPTTRAHRPLPSAAQPPGLRLCHHCPRRHRQACRARGPPRPPPPSFLSGGRQAGRGC
jgi:translation initiation factor IF-2